MVNLNIGNINHEALILTIYNVVGEFIYSEKFEQNQQQINVGNLSNGVYIVEINAKNGRKNKN